MQGKIILFCGPSGSGKTTVTKHLLARNSALGFSVSATTRKLRGIEKDGVDYQFISEKDFLHKIKENEFIEWEEVYNGVYYGTLKSELEKLWAQNKTVIFDVDVRGGLALKKQFGEKALAVFVMPPSIEALEERLYARRTENPASLQQRMDKAKQELGYAKLFDHVIINQDLHETLMKAEQMVDKFLKS